MTGDIVEGETRRRDKYVAKTIQAYIRCPGYGGKASLTLEKDGLFNLWTVETRGGPYVVKRFLFYRSALKCFKKLFGKYGVTLEDK